MVLTSIAQAESPRHDGIALTPYMRIKKLSKNENIVTRTALHVMTHMYTTLGTQLLMSVYFSHSRYWDHHVETMYRTIEKHTTNYKKCIPIVGGDFNAELGPGYGTECISVGRHTLNRGNSMTVQQRNQEMRMQKRKQEKSKERQQKS